MMLVALGCDAESLTRLRRSGTPSDAGSAGVSTASGGSAGGAGAGGASGAFVGGSSGTGAGAAAGGAGGMDPSLGFTWTPCGTIPAAPTDNPNDYDIMSLAISGDGAKLATLAGEVLIWDVA